MTTLDALRDMLAKSGLTAYGAAKALGKSHTYVSNLFTRGTVPNADRLALIASACDYDLALIPRAGGDPILIDGTTRAD